MFQVTSEEVVSAYISRAQEVNPYINVIVGSRFDDALKEAREIDKMIASDNIPDKYSADLAPYLGVPLTTKEAISIKGEYVTGSYCMRWIIDLCNSFSVCFAQFAGCLVK